MTTSTAKQTASNSKAAPQKSDVDAPFTEKATSAAHEAVDSLSSRAATAESSVRHGASSSAQTLSEKQLEARIKMAEYSGKTRQLASENPLATAGIAFAAGMLVTSLLGRRK
ncbi:MAG: DUF883 domain-containing protein [Pseudoalteromonas sp.]|uniref:DUF883 domain-containing protein n=1 Tax=unclassified Pseudoalteromonas TaxID=194690 RepID=UPI003F9A3176